MQRTKIEWVRNPDGSQGYTANPLKGLCPVGCSYCYARRIYKRFKLDEEIRYDVGAWHKGVDIDKLKQPSRIFVGSTMELFGPWVTDFSWHKIFGYIQGFTEHTFIFLSKRPWELKKYNPWPENCWVGMSATNMSQIGDIPLMADVQAKVRFVSFEPLLDYSAPDLRYIDWAIIGEKTPVSEHIPSHWISGIVAEADRNHAAVFCKNNLGLLKPRQEWPNKVEVGK